MDIKKLAPWNWFKNEEQESRAIVPVQRDEKKPLNQEEGPLNPLFNLHREMDRLFDNAFRGFGLSPFRSEIFSPLTTSGLLKPQVDVGATDKEYLITVEVPGVSEKDVNVEVSNNTPFPHMFLNCLNGNLFPVEDTRSQCRFHIGLFKYL